MTWAARIAWCAAVAAMLSGCTLYRETSRYSFVDEDGNFLVACNGELSRSYTYDVVSPVNGAKLTNKDRRLVKVQFPNGEWNDFYYCQQDVPEGTTYLTKDKVWKYWTTGLMSRLYLISEDGSDYLLVFEGECCDATGKGGAR